MFLSTSPRDAAAVRARPGSVAASGRASCIYAGVSLFALAIASPARANCIPDTTRPNPTIVCSGLIQSGLSVATDSANVIIETGAELHGPGGAYAVALAPPSDPFRSVTINQLKNNGVITSGGIAIGINGDSSRAAIRILTNNGEIRGDSGGIAVPLQNLTNTGLIDGGSGAAIRTDVDNFLFTSPIVKNQGTISSASDQATVVVGSGFGGIVNSGTIVNTGSGAAVEGGRVSLTVETGGVVTGGTGGVALHASQGLSVTNHGLITGDVIGGSDFEGNFVDNRDGTINGSIVLSDRDDSLIALMGTDSLIANVNGTVDGGTGNDTLELVIREDRAVSKIATPASFEVLQFTLEGGATLTVNGPSVSSGGIAVRGTGEVVIGSDITQTGPVLNSSVIPQNIGFESVSFRNDHTITVTLPADPVYVPPAIQIRSGTEVVNNGTIDVTGGNALDVTLNFSPDDRVLNTGTIAADGIAVRLEKKLENQGLIRSRNGVAVVNGLGGGTVRDSLSTNSGTIEGNTAGVRVDAITFRNEGSISASNGAGVELGFYGSLQNAAGATITGTTAAVKTIDLNPVVTNAGTLNGDVLMGDFSGSNAVFVNDGGVVNGNLLFGRGDDVFVTNLPGDGGSPFAGISGDVDPGLGRDRLQLRVQADSTASIASVGDFESLAYEVVGGAKLTLAASAGNPGQLALAGQGSVDLSANLTAFSGPALDLTASDTAALTGVYPTPANMLAVVSRGNLTVDNNISDQASVGVNVGTSSTFENAGTITVTGKAQLPGTAVAIRAAGFSTSVRGAVINSGEIQLSDARGIDGDEVTNSGLIHQTGGATGSYGVHAIDVTNTGTISVGGVAVDLSGFPSGQQGFSLVNSGTLESTGGIAVMTSSPAFIDNQATGVITAANGAPAVTGSVVTLSNAGTINGGVVLTGGSNMFVSRGGTVNGNVTLSDGDDAVLLLGDSAGVTGTIDGKGGSDTFARAYSADADIDINAALPDSFERAGVGAIGAETVVTLTGTPASNVGVELFGDGRIINRSPQKVAFDAPLFAGSRVTVGSLNKAAGLTSGLDLINEADLADGVSGRLRAFSNTAVIGRDTLGFAAIALTASGGESFSFDNRGTIRRGADGGFDQPAVVLFGADSPLLYGNEDSAPTAAALVNSGTIEQGLTARFQSKTFEFANSGTISGRVADVDRSAIRAISVEIFEGNTSTKLENSGQVSGGVTVLATTPSFTFANSGMIDEGTTSFAQSIRTPTIYFRLLSATDQAASIDNSGAITSVSPAGIALLLDDLNSQPAEPGSPELTRSVSLTNSGTIAASGGAVVETLGPSARLSVTAALITDTNETSSPAISLVNAGGGRIEAGGAAMLVEGDFGAAIEALPAGFGSVAGLARGHSLNLDNLGVIAGGPGSDLSILGADGGVSAGNNSNPVTEFPDHYLAGAIQTVGSVDTIVNRAGGSIIGSVDLGDFDDTFSNYGSIVGDVFLRAGSDKFVIGALSSVTGIVDGGTGTNALVIDTTGGTGQKVALDAYLNFASLTFTGSGNVNVSGEVGTDSIRIAGGSLTVAAGETLKSASSVTVLGANTDDTLINSGTIAGGVELAGGADMITNGGLITGGLSLGDGADQVTNAATGRLAGLNLGDGDDQLSNAGTITGTVDFGDGNDRFTNSGDLTGASVDFGAGVDTFVWQAGSRLGSISGGTGVAAGQAESDLLVLALGGTEAAPARPDFSSFSGFEHLRQDSGVVALSNSLAMQRIEISGGRFIGLAGSTINSPQIVVASGATFGSAGTVNGNLDVAGTLSPGASPGTMQVNGNVSLGASSNSVFELTPMISDQLLISGTLTIADGASLTLTQQGQLKPGASLDLIVADGGITGRFSTVSSPGILGFVRQTSNKVQLLGQFLNTGFSPQVTRAIDYTNAILVGGSATQALIDRLPRLITSAGGTNGEAFARLSGEAYASAYQIGTEHGLTLSTAARSLDLGSEEARGWFGFGAGLVHERSLRGDSSGVSRADIRSRGLLGGIGFAAQNAAIAGFVGTIDSDQTVRTLGASTDADGVFAGITARYGTGPFAARATLAYDGSSGTTARQLPDGLSGRGSYQLHSWIGDLSASYGIDLTHGWSLAPELGYTWISTRRGADQEQSASPFGLRLLRDTRDASFVDGSLTLRSEPENGTVSAWLKAGVRQQLSGERGAVVAGFTGSNLNFESVGVQRSSTSALVGAGLAVQLTPRVSLFGAYQGEFGSSGDGHDAKLGVRLAF